MVIPAAKSADTIMPSARIPEQSTLHILMKAILGPTLLMWTGLVPKRWIFRFTWGFT